MKLSYKLATAATVVLLAAGCAAQPDRLGARTNDSIFLDGDRLHTGTGMTVGSGGGSLSGGSSAPAPKEQRANTAPGVDRDGHGPAAGAIVDPTGAATRAKP